MPNLASAAASTSRTIASTSRTIAYRVTSLLSLGS